MDTKKNGAAVLLEDSFPSQRIYLQYLFVFEIKLDIYVLKLIGISIGVAVFKNYLWLGRYGYFRELQDILQMVLSRVPLREDQQNLTCH